MSKSTIKAWASPSSIIAIVSAICCLAFASSAKAQTADDSPDDDSASSVATVDEENTEPTGSGDEAGRADSSDEHVGDESGQQPTRDDAEADVDASPNDSDDGSPEAETAAPQQQPDATMTGPFWSGDASSPAPPQVAPGGGAPDDTSTTSIEAAPEAVDEPAPASAPSPRQPPRLELRTEDGDSSIRFQIATQLRWTYTNEDGGPGQPATSDNDIRFRRLRLIFGGSLVSRDFSYKLHFNLVPGAMELMDFFIDYRFADQFALRFGQWKVPFTRYRLGSWATRPTLEWSNPTRWFGAERQIGLTAHNNVSRPPRFEYQIGVYTGDNARASNGVGMARLFRESRPNPSDLTDPEPPRSFHPEIAAHFAYNHGGIDVRAPQDFEGGGPRFSLGLSATWDLRPTPRQDMAARIAPEAILKLHGFTLWGVFYLIFWEEVADDEETRLGMLGGVAQASYVFLDRFEVGLRYTNVAMLSAIRRDAQRYADLRIAAAEDDASREELINLYNGIGLVEAEHEITLGFSTYFLARTLKLGVDGALAIHQRVDRNRYDLQIQIQAQLAF